MNPSNTENPVASTPKTPGRAIAVLEVAAFGRRRRTSSSAATATAVTAAMIRNPQTMFIAVRSRLPAPSTVRHRGARPRQPGSGTNVATASGGGDGSSASFAAATLARRMKIWIVAASGTAVRAPRTHPAARRTA